MKSSICTGVYLEPVAPVGWPCGINGPCVIGERIVNPNVLFDASSTSEYSRSFQVVEGNCVQLTAYSLAGASVQIEKLFLDPSANIPFDPTQCGMLPFVPAPAILACKPVCSWVLNDCSDVRYICAAGVYRLHLVPASALGQAFVVMERSQRLNNPVPEGMVLGA